jgi:hypothetical protein
MVNIVSDIKTHALSNGKVKFPCSLIILSTYPHPLPPPVVRLTPKAFQLERPRVSLCWSNLKAIGQSVFKYLIVGERKVGQTDAQTDIILKTL